MSYDLKHDIRIRGGGMALSVLSRVMLDTLAPVGGLYISDADRNAGFVDGGCTCELSRRSLGVIGV